MRRRGFDSDLTLQRHSRPQIVILYESHLLIEAAELAHERELRHDRRRPDLRVDSQHLLEDPARIGYKRYGPETDFQPIGIDSADGGVAQRRASLDSISSSCRCSFSAAHRSSESRNATYRPRARAIPWYEARRGLTCMGAVDDAGARIWGAAEESTRLVVRAVVDHDELQSSKVWAYTEATAARRYARRLNVGITTVTNGGATNRNLTAGDTVLGRARAVYAALRAPRGRAPRWPVASASHRPRGARGARLRELPVPTGTADAAHGLHSAM